MTTNPPQPEEQGKATVRQFMAEFSVYFAEKSVQINLITFFNRMSYLASIVIEVSIERDCTWQETMEAWQDGR